MGYEAYWKSRDTLGTYRTIYKGGRETCYPQSLFLLKERHHTSNGDEGEKEEEKVVITFEG